MDINLTAALSTTPEYESTAKKTSTDKKDVAKAQKDDQRAAVYEKSEDQGANTTYSINKMSADQRSALVKQLKADQEERAQSLKNLAQQMITKQAGVFNDANDIWSFLREGKYTVDAETKAKAQADIAEDGYYGVKQTSKRLFDFASALAGDDEKTMKKMQEAVEKGYKQAEKTWGGKLPEISQKTLEATNKLFDDYFQSKKSKETVEE